MRARWIAAPIFFLLAGGCATPPSPSTELAAAREAPSIPVDFPVAEYERAAARGEPVYRIDPERSLAVVRVYRAGPLARFGHDHVVACRSMQGYARLVGSGVRADIYAPLRLLGVDEPALRAEAGFDTQPSPADIDGTRRNMLDKVLEAERFPFVVLHVAPGERDFDIAVTLHGTTRPIPAAVELEQSGGESLRAHGRFSLRQTEFGIAPFAVLGGALRVRDEVDIAFDVYATRVGADDFTRPAPP